MIRTDHSNAFARLTMRSRVPTIIREVHELNPDFPQPMLDALLRHAESMENNALIPMLELPTHDYGDWLQAWLSHRGDTWLNTDWFFAEIYNYRLLMQIVRWFELGSDPFAPKKHEELSGTALWETLERALATRALPVEERLTRMLHFDLWGNRIDLSYAAARAHGSAVGANDLLVDDSVKVVEHLLTARHKTVHFILDNAGTELAIDLALADTLLNGIAERVVLHLKYHPTFVSDAIPADVIIFLSRLERRTGEAQALGKRLQTALDNGRLRLIPDPYWNSTRLFWDLAPHIAQTLRDAMLVIVKGDANYRRIAGDALWPPETPFSDALAYARVPLLALRTLKSDTVLGLPKGLAEKLEAADAQWRVNGKHGVIQSANLSR
jgi:hypothetical protein